MGNLATAIALGFYCTICSPTQGTYRDIIILTVLCIIERKRACSRNYALGCNTLRPSCLFVYVLQLCAWLVMFRI